ncbi:hypothetical protein AALD74_12120 [Lachnospiraceae bacterium 48-21]
MANICCDDVYFYSESNPENLNALWEDLEKSIIFCQNEDLAWIGNLFQTKDICTEGISLRGTVIYMERNDESILLSTSAAWSPLYDAYCAIAGAYQVDFVMQAIEPGCNIYINTDYSGKYFPDRYAISIEDENFLTPAGFPVGTKLEYGELFAADDVLLERFAEMGYPACSLKMLERLLEDTGIEIHRFEDSYSTEPLTKEDCA